MEGITDIMNNHTMEVTTGMDIMEVIMDMDIMEDIMVTMVDLRS